MLWVFFYDFWDGPVNLVGRGGEVRGSGGMTSEQFFFAAILGLQFFFFWACAVQIIFCSNLFSEGERGGVKIGSICVSP